MLGIESQYAVEHTCWQLIASDLAKFGVILGWVIIQIVILHPVAYLSNWEKAMRPFGITYAVFMRDIHISFWPWVALLSRITVSDWCDFTNIRDDVAVVDPEGCRAKRSERVKKTREFTGPEVFGKVLITTNVAPHTKNFSIIFAFLRFFLGGAL